MFTGLKMQKDTSRKWTANFCCCTESVYSIQISFAGHVDSGKKTSALFLETQNNVVNGIQQETVGQTRTIMDFFSSAVLTREDHAEWDQLTAIVTACTWSFCGVYNHTGRAVAILGLRRLAWEVFTFCQQFRFIRTVLMQNHHFFSQSLSFSDLSGGKQ